MCSRMLALKREFAGDEQLINEMDQKETFEKDLSAMYCQDSSIKEEPSMKEESEQESEMKEESDKSQSFSNKPFQSEKSTKKAEALNVFISKQSPNISTYSSINPDDQDVELQVLKLLKQSFPQYKIDVTICACYHYLKNQMLYDQSENYGKQSVVSKSTERKKKNTVKIEAEEIKRRRRSKKDNEITKCASRKEDSNEFKIWKFILSQNYTMEQKIAESFIHSGYGILEAREMLGEEKLQSNLYNNTITKIFRGVLGIIYDMMKKVNDMGPMIEHLSANELRNFMIDYKKSFNQVEIEIFVKLIRSTMAIDKDPIDYDNVKTLYVKLKMLKHCLIGDKPRPGLVSDKFSDLIRF